MNGAGADIQSVIGRARELRGAGRADEATKLLQQFLGSEPGHAAGWNLLGLIQLDLGSAGDAVASFTRAVQADPAPPLWLNLSRAQQAVGDRAAALESIDAALARDSFYLPALLAKGAALRSAGREAEALEIYRPLLDGISDTSSLPAAVVAQLEEARSFVRAEGERQFRAAEKMLAKVAADFPDADMRRLSAYAEQRTGKRKVYQQQPTGPHFPYLPAIEFFDRSLFPWFERLEAHTSEIRAELLSLWSEDDPDFRPYVTYEPWMPVNQWSELNHSRRWSAWFFWEDGVRNDAAFARCPKTAAALGEVPLLDIPGKGPTAMFSMLEPRTRIPAHTGTTNARVTVHLPLVVPDGCGFRVGAETREWREGECWAFDDTIEHEAWNDSDQPRAILILDAWNPFLTEAEKAAVRLLG
jgi:aspartate beta-hydroxylase